MLTEEMEPACFLGHHLHLRRPQSSDHTLAEKSPVCTLSDRFYRLRSIIAFYSQKRQCAKFMRGFQRSINAQDTPASVCVPTRVVLHDSFISGGVCIKKMVQPQVHRVEKTPWTEGRLGGAGGNSGLHRRLTQRHHDEEGMATSTPPHGQAADH